MSAPSFATDIKPLFREKDRTAMLGAFDLWKYDDVVKHAQAILGAVGAGKMPCDGAWPPASVDLLKSWVDGGTLP
jgi:hypothetical protein